MVPTNPREHATSANDLIIYTPSISTEAGVGIEKEIQSATSQEKVVVFRKFQVLTAYYPSNRPKVAAYFGVSWFGESKKDWRPEVE